MVIFGAGASIVTFVIFLGIYNLRPPLCADVRNEAITAIVVATVVSLLTESLAVRFLLGIVLSASSVR